MKRVLSVLLSVALLAALLATGAAATTPEATVDEYVVSLTPGALSYSEDAYHVSYSGLTPGGQYLLLVVKPEAAVSYIKEAPFETGEELAALAARVTNATYVVNGDSITHIDQTADTAGTVSFDFVPMSVVDSLVILTGTGLAEPVRIGLIKSQGVTVTGSVSYLGTLTKPVVTLTDTTNASVVFTATVADPVSGTASYAFDGVPEGTYTLRLTKVGHLAANATVVVSDQDVSVPAKTLYGGDTDADGGVTLSDLSSILNAFGQSGLEIVIPGNDIDEDGGVTLTDLSTTLTNFGM